MMRVLLGICFGLGLAAAQANAPSSSVRPLIRGGESAATDKVRIVRVATSILAPAKSVRPEIRRQAKKTHEPNLGKTRSVQIGARLGPGKPSVRPKQRPKVTTRNVGAGSTQQAGLFKKREPRVSAKGSVCGVNEIKGSKIPAIPGRIRGCGVASPVAVTSISGVALSTPAKMDCATAKALNSWVENSVKPTVGKLGGGVSSLKVAAHYACRTRNNKKGAKISEHGKGRAIDISAINLNNGKTITVLNGWSRSVEGEILKRMHNGACGPFGTVLGPNSDRYHRDHFHLDTARYRSGPYCR